MLKKTDEYYIKQIRAGKNHLYTKLVDRHRSFAFNLAFRIVQQKEEAEEVAQDAFIKAYNALESFKSNAKFKTWLYRIVYNTAISRMRGKSIESTELNESITEEEEALTADGLSNLTSSERKKELEKALTLLAEDDKALILLYYWEGLAVAEIADTMEMTVSNVKIKLMRARKKLYSFLKSSLKEEVFEIL